MSLAETDANSGRMILRKTEEGWIFLWREEEEKEDDDNRESLGGGEKLWEEAKKLDDHIFAFSLLTPYHILPLVPKILRGKPKKIKFYIQKIRFVPNYKRLKENLDRHNQQN